MKAVNASQLDQLKAIGAYLAKVREDQDRTLEEIAAKTYIPLRLLRALEQGQQQLLPEPIFVQGFIRRYADALGIDGLNLSREFPVHSNYAVHDPGSDGFQDGSAPSPADDFEPLKSASGRSTSPIGLYALLGLGALALIGGAIALGNMRPAPRSATPAGSPAPKASPVRSPAPAAPAPATPVSPAPATPVSPAPAAIASPGSPSPTPATAAPVTVTLDLTDRSWTEVFVDGRAEYKGMLQPNTQRTFSAQREIRVIAGNAGAVNVSHNNAPAKPLGNLGEVKTVRFSPTAAQP